MESVPLLYLFHLFINSTKTVRKIEIKNDGKISMDEKKNYKTNTKNWKKTWQPF